jgi:ribonuclease HII
MLIAGVDDAGRGPAIGPLVIAGVLMREEDLPRLAELGVRDSKLLTPHRREVLAPQIKQIAQNYTVAKLSPMEIDDVVINGRKLRKLNWLEAKTMAKVIQTLKPDKAYVDASDILEDRFKQDILSFLTFNIPIVSEHKADRTYPIVSAASIIAKVERDKEIAQLASVYGNFGSGYPSDPRTIEFLQRCLEKMEEYPEFVRKSWKPVQKAKADRESRQTKLIGR